MRSYGYIEVPKEDLYPESDPTYFLSYICLDVDSSIEVDWKCGCRTVLSCDESGQWQIQLVP